jgi:hypothetical protein
LYGIAIQTKIKLEKLLTRQTTGTAVTVYIVIVGIIYNTILRFLGQLTGLQWVLNELEHLIIPLLFLIYWFIFIPKNQLQWNNFWPWLIYPLVYVIFVFIRGSFSGFYPYPFLNVIKIGFNQALINSLYVTIAFFAVSLLFIAIGKGLSRKG